MIAKSQPDSMDRPLQVAGNDVNASLSATFDPLRGVVRQGVAVFRHARRERAKPTVNRMTGDLHIDLDGGHRELTLLAAVLR